MCLCAHCTRDMGQDGHCIKSLSSLCLPISFTSNTSAPRTFCLTCPTPLTFTTVFLVMLVVSMLWLISVYKHVEATWFLPNKFPCSIDFFFSFLFNKIWIRFFLLFSFYCLFAVSFLYSRKFPMKQGVSAFYMQKMVCSSLLPRSEACLFCLSGYAQSPKWTLIESKI